MFGNFPGASARNECKINIFAPLFHKSPLSAGVCINSLHQLVMLGPKEPYHKKHSPEKVGQQSAKDHGAILRSSVQACSSDSRSDLRDPRLLANFNHNYAKIQNSFE